MKHLSLYVIFAFLGLLVIATGCPKEPPKKQDNKEDVKKESVKTQASPNAPQAAAPGEAPKGDEDPAIKEAKAKDPGNDLPAGQTRRVDTSNGPVEVSRTKDGKIDYKKP